MSFDLFLLSWCSVVVLLSVALQHNFNFILLSFHHGIHNAALLLPSAIFF